MENTGREKVKPNNIQISGIPVEWNPERGTCTFGNLPVAMMWVDTTLAGLMSGVQAMVGTERFALALQSEGRKSVASDWQEISKFPDFHEGFKAIANIASVAGWGEWALTSLDEERKECRFRVAESWEGLYQRSLRVCWGSWMLAGKLAGYCSKHFGTNCWADQTAFIANGDAFDEFVVKPSSRSIEKEVGSLLATDEATRADMAVALRRLETEIAERKRAEEALRASEEKYRLLIQNSNDAIFVAQDGVIKFPNLKTEKLLSYSAAELAQIPFINHIHPDDRGLVLENHKKRMEGQEFPNTYAFRVKIKSGEELWVEINAVRILWEERPATLNFIRDITEKKKLEAQYLQAQKMEAVGTLAGGVAHDFNNLLMGIQGYVSLMLLEMGPNDPHYKMLKTIEEQVRSGADLTWQLLGFARGGKFEVKPADLNAIVKKTSTMFGRTKKEIAIHSSLQQDLWSVEVDRGQIEQVFINLYVNAWQAMSNGGALYLETKNVTLDEEYKKTFYIKPGNYVKISVTDTGVGMDEKTLKRIFEPFFTTKEMGRGTGLGLATAYGIIKGHGGLINAYSEKGHGATFTIYLPASGKKVEKEKKLAEEPCKGKETILLVDDEEVILNVSRMILDKLGYKVFTAQGGQKAIEVFRAKKDCIDLVILDMIMPGTDGGKVFEILKSIQADVKVILSSGYSINHEITSLMERGCQGFIQKPFDIGSFSKKIRDVLAGGEIQTSPPPTDRYQSPLN
jgi:two-component system, cell cycle sensor histidine kinase and response regulator CckA